MDPLLIGLFALIVIAVGVGAYMAGARRRSIAAGPAEAQKRLEEHGFYPFVINPDGHVEFSADDFDEAVRHFLQDRNETAARDVSVSPSSDSNCG